MNDFVNFSHIDKGIYKLVDSSSRNMYTLYTFLMDGLGIDSYENFLNNNKKKIMYANVSELIKCGDLVNIIIDPDIYPDLPSYTMKIVDMLLMLREWRRLTNLRVGEIKIIIKNDDLLIVSDAN